MQTKLADFIKDTQEGKDAEAILRRCVHCGFCTATCPTYQLTGDELDGPRGRIYLIKEVLEGAPVTAKTQLHLDRCLTCRACETTCPSGVQYGRLVDIGRKIVDERVERPLSDRVMRKALAAALPRPGFFGPLLKLGQALRPVLPFSLQDKVPVPGKPAGAWPAPRHSRKMIALAGCVQGALAPEINAAAARVLDALGISLIEVPAAGCCGALRFHLNDQAAGRDDMRRAIDAWWPALEAGAEGLVMTASGCGVMVKEYAHHLAADAAYAVRAERVSGVTRDLGEVIAAELDRLAPLLRRQNQRPVTKIAFHPPCTLQHGQQLRGLVERILIGAGFELTPIEDAHLCCGSAGTYSMLQPEFARRLRDAKLASLQAGGPEVIASANIGCLTHLGAGTPLPVRHWITLLDEALR